jgi:hypothetical protein
MRVWFAGDALYMFNNDFSHFVVPWADIDKFVNFDEILK